MGKRFCIALLAVVSLVFVPAALAHDKSVTNNCFDDHHGPDIPGVTPTLAGIHVTWVDRCSNESNYVVIRGQDVNVAAMTSVGTVPRDSEEYWDTTASCGVTYYYAVETSKPAFTSETQASPAVMIVCAELKVAPEPAHRIVCAPVPIKLGGSVISGPGTVDLDQRQADELVAAGLVSPAFYVDGVGITCDNPAAKYGAVQVLAAGSPVWVNAGGQDLGAADSGRNYLYYRL